MHQLAILWIGIDCSCAAPIDFHSWREATAGHWRSRGFGFELRFGLYAAPCLCTPWPTPWPCSVCPGWAAAWLLPACRRSRSWMGSGGASCCDWSQADSARSSSNPLSGWRCWLFIWTYVSSFSILIPWLAVLKQLGTSSLGFEVGSFAKAGSVRCRCTTWSRIKPVSFYSAVFRVFWIAYITLIRKCGFQCLSGSFT